MFQTTEQMHLYAQQTQQRVTRINMAITANMQAERRSYTRDVRVTKLNSYIHDKVEILTEQILMGTYTQKRINVIEQYLQELEVLLNLDHLD